MKIGVLSDTHIPYTGKTIPQKVLALFAEVDAIIHAGDFQEAAVIETLESIADFYGVCGNMDPPEIKMILPDKRILHLGGFSIGVIHGWGSPKGLEERVFSSFDGEKLDAIIYGHSHIPANYVNSNILFFNPGSPTDTRFAKSNSIGILTLDTKISGEIIKF